MQNLPSKFANFIQEENIEYVFLIGPKTIVNCKILISKKHRSSTKIGQGWRLFCSENDLKEGDIVVFQANNDFIEPNIEVFVNGCCCDYIKPNSVMLLFKMVYFMIYVY